MYIKLDLDGKAPRELEGFADSGAWGSAENDEVYGVVLTANGGAVYHCTKRINLVTAGTTFQENIATTKCVEKMIYCRNICNVLDFPGADMPTVIGTDNKANFLLASGLGNAGNARHAIRRWVILQQHVKAGDCAIKHVPGDSNPSDFLTKWLAKKQFLRSLYYVINFYNHADPTLVTNYENLAKI